MSPNTNFFGSDRSSKRQETGLASRATSGSVKRSIQFAKEREKLCPVGGQESAPVQFSLFWDLGLNRTGDWDYTLTKPPRRQKNVEWSFSSGNFIQTHPRMQRQARQQGEKGRSGLTGSAFCLQTENIAIGFLTLSRVRKFSLSYSCLLRSPVCTVTKYCCDVPGLGRS